MVLCSIYSTILIMCCKLCFWPIMTAARLFFYHYYLCYSEPKCQTSIIIGHSQFLETCRWSFVATGRGYAFTLTQILSKCSAHCILKKCGLREIKVCAIVWSGLSRETSTIDGSWIKSWEGPFSDARRNFQKNVCDNWNLGNSAVWNLGGQVDA